MPPLENVLEVDPERTPCHLLDCLAGFGGSSPHLTGEIAESAAGLFFWLCVLRALCG